MLAAFPWTVFQLLLRKTSRFLSRLGDRMKHLLKSAWAACALLLLAASPVAHAQSGVVTKASPNLGTNKMTASSYWTPERFRAAKPMPLPQ
jgi:hypothetical protein